jgi:triosephosphate isomerase (TIM)
MLIINFKTYHESLGQNALSLAKTIDEAASNSPVDVLIAVSALDIQRIADQVQNILVIAQDIDPVGYGAHTGAMLPEELKHRGAVGTLINHSERPKSDDQLGEAIDFAQSVFPDYTIVCTPSFEKTCKIDHHWDPHFIAYEPPELIGGNISVSNSQPNIISKVVGISSDRQILVGAGIKTVEDIKISLDLGAIGVLVASGVVKAEDPGEKVKEFLNAWR